MCPGKPYIWSFFPSPCPFSHRDWWVAHLQNFLHLPNTDRNHQIGKLCFDLAVAGAEKSDSWSDNRAERYCYHYQGYCVPSCASNACFDPKCFDHKRNKNTNFRQFDVSRGEPFLGSLIFLELIFLREFFVYLQVPTYFPVDLSPLGHSRISGSKMSSLRTQELDFSGLFFCS